MSTKNILSTLTLVLCSITFMQAQSQKLQRANKEFDRYNYEVAIPLYLQVLDKNDDPVAKSRLAESYRRTNNWKDAEYWYGQVVNLPDAKSTYFLYYGMALQANGKCDLAKEWFEEYTKLEPDSHRGILLSKACTQDEIEVMINKCNSCYEIQAVPINTKYDDFAPVIQDGGLVFASERDNSGITDRIHEWTGFPFLELFFTKVDTLDAENYEYTYEKKPKEYRGKINTKFHDGPVAFSKDGEKIYITRNNYFEKDRGKDDEGVTRLKIFIGDKKKNEWANLTGLPFNSDEYSVAHPSITDDGTRLYFSSDMPGGFGGMDLYYTEQEGEQWGPPINLGPIINTEGHEVFPYIDSKNSRLYFSSDGQIGLGGLDIHYSIYQDEKWMSPSNVGAPINSKWDDHNIVLNETETFGYFASNREGGLGRDDIYSFRKKVVKVEILVFDQATGLPIPNAEVFVDCSKETLTTNTKGVIEIEMPVDKCCNYSATKSSYEDNELEGCTEGYEAGSKMFLKIPLGRPMAFNLAGMVYDDSTNKPVPDALVQLLNDCDIPFREFTTGLDGRYEFPELDKDCCYSIKVIKDQQSANSIYMYLAKTISKVCTKGQTVSKDFEVDIPLIPIYTFADDFNRPNNGQGSFAGGGNNPNNPNKSNDPNNPNNLDNLNNPNNPNNPSYPGSNLNEGESSSGGYLRNGGGYYAVPTAFIIKHIYYDFDKSYIRNDAEGPLDTLYNILVENPRYIVEIGSHTDSRGSNRYNERLSKRRAKAVVTYLVNRGIPSTQLTYKGYGENDPTNECANLVPCQEEQHQRNRRTEFRIIGTIDGIQFDTKATSVAPRYIKTDPCINCPF
jgi:outer membrane protein OmpA-like peptidoglycan-associated protein